MFWSTAAYAMGGAPQGGEAGAAGLASFIPLILMFAIFYFLLIRPQQKRAKEHKAMLQSLGRGDRVVTAGGLYGRILDLDESTVVLDLGDSTVTVGRGYISALAEAGPRIAPQEQPRGKKGKGKKAQPKAEASAPVVEEAPVEEVIEEADAPAAGEADLDNEKK